MKNKHFRRLEVMYDKARIDELYSPVIMVAEGTAEIEMPVQDKFFHSAGATHGSFYFKALDDAAYFAAGSIVEDVFVLTVTYTIHIARPVSKGKIKAVGRVVNSTKNTILAESFMINSEAKEIARGLGSFVRSKIPWTEAGY